jgi:hypothetical protein
MTSSRFRIKLSVLSNLKIIDDTMNVTDRRLDSAIGTFRDRIPRGFDFWQEKELFSIP